MGVELAVYRTRIGNFVPRNTDQVLSNTDYLCKAIASVRSELVRRDQWPGTVSFINQLLLTQGIEPNPGPRCKDDQVQSKGSEMSDRPQGRATWTDLSDHLQGRTTGTEISDHLWGQTTATEISDHPQGQATRTVMPSYSQGGATGTVVPAYPQGGATGTVVPAYPQGGATGTVVPAYPQGGVTFLQVKEQNINLSFPGGENQVIGDNNKITINRPEMSDETKAFLTEIKEDIIAKFEQAMNPGIPQEKSQQTTGTQTTGSSAISASMETNAKHEKEEKEEKVKEMLARQKNLEDAAEATIGKFIDDNEDVLVVRTKGVKAVAKCLKNYSMAIITGVTGEGKTTLAAQILKDLRDGTLDETIKGKTPLQIFLPEDWSTVVNIKEDIVVFVDDIFGTSNYQVDLLNRWKPLFKAMEQSLKNKVMLLLTSRTHILADARRDAGVTEGSVDHILSEKKTVDITDKYQLTLEEQRNMLGNYSVFYKRDDSFKYKTSQQPLNRSMGFPLVCSQFFNDPQLYEKGQKFFENPDKLLASEIEKMSKCEQRKYFALVYCFLQPNHKVDSRDLNPLDMSEEDRHMLQQCAEVCDVECTNHTSLLKNALKSLTRTYLRRDDTFFTFSHESVAENVCLVFGSENPKITLQKCSNRVILELLDLSHTGQTTPPSLHVPETCFDVLSQRIFEMVTKKQDIWSEKLTLESFSRFQNQMFANHFFEYLSKQSLVEEVITVHSNQHISSNPDQRSLLSACANNVAFLSAFFRSKGDEYMINKFGALHFTALIQDALHRAIEHQNLQTIKFLLKQGAVLDTICLTYVYVLDCNKDIMQIVLTGNMWTESELEKDIYNTVKGKKFIEELAVTKPNVRSLKQQLCNIKPLRIGNGQDQSRQTRNHARGEITKSAPFEEMLSQLLATAPNSERRKSLLKEFICSKGKTLSDVICIRRILGSFDAALIQYALRHCNTDIIRFLILSSNLTNDQLDALLSKEVHSGHPRNTDILCRVGGRLNHEDFVHVSGTYVYGVSKIVNIMAGFGQFPADVLSHALKSALCSGSEDTIDVLLHHGAKCKIDHDTIYKAVACRRYPDTFNIIDKYLDKRHVSVALDAAVHSGQPLLVKKLISSGGKFTNHALITAVCRTSAVFEMVNLVATSRKWSCSHFTKALSKAVEICRSEVVTFLHKKGGKFGNDSLQKVLGWNVEHHVQVATIRYILGARKWAACGIQTALVAATERLFVTNDSRKVNFTAFVELLSYKEKNISTEQNYVDDVKIGIFDIIRKLENQIPSNAEVLGAILNRSVEYGRVDVATHLIEVGHTCGDDCLVHSVCSKGCMDSSRLELVRLIRLSRKWSDSVQTEALDKALQNGYEDIVLFLHENGAKFGDESLSHSIQANSHDHDSLHLVDCVLRFKEDLTSLILSDALVKSINYCNYQMIVHLHQHGAEFPDGSLQQIICNWKKSSNRKEAVAYVCSSRTWTREEMQEALLEAVKSGDLQITSCISNMGAHFFDRCLAEAMEKR